MTIPNLTTKLTKPWAITPAGFADARASMTPEAFFALSDFVNARPTWRMDDANAAHVWIKGALGDDMPPIWQVVGNTDYRTLQAEIADVLESDPLSLVLHVDSPGGMCAGLPEAALAIQEAARNIHVRAEVRGMACSAAYYLACFADEIVASQSSDVGNIGTVMAWADATDFYNDLGVTFNVLTNEGADLKGMFHDAGRLNESQIAFLQDQVNALGAEFRAVVEGSRNVEPEVFRAGWYSGARAVELGLIDAII